MKKKVVYAVCMLVAISAICITLFMAGKPDMAVYIAGYLVLASGMLFTMRSSSLGSRLVKPYMLLYGICFLVMVSGMVIFKNT